MDQMREQMRASAQHWAQHFPILGMQWFFGTALQLPPTHGYRPQRPSHMLPSLRDSSAYSSTAAQVALCVTGMLGRLQPAWLFRGLVDANPDITFHLFYVLQDGFVFSSFAANSYAASFARLENATAIIEALTRSRRRTRYTIIARKSRTI